MFNVDYRLDLVTLGEHLGMQWDEDSYVEIPRHHNPNALWRSITGKNEMDTSSLHISDVSHPVLRFWLRTMNETLFSRTEPGNANCNELAILDAHLNVERKPRFSLFLPHFFARHLVSIVNNPRKEISIGGVLTYLARKLVPDHDWTGMVPFKSSTEKMDTRYFKNYIRTSNDSNYFWKLPGGEIPFPIANLPPLVPLDEAGEYEHHDFPSYTLHVAHPPAPQGDHASTSRPREPTPPREHQEPYGYAREDFGMGQYYVAPHRAQNDGPSPLPSEREQYLERGLTQYGQHHWLVQQGIIARTGPHPPFYTNPYAHDGGYPGTLFERAGIDQEDWYQRFGDLWRGPPGDGQGNLGDNMDHDGDGDDENDDGEE